MATKTIAWESGGGYITLTYTGKGSAPISVQSDANDSFDYRQQVVSIVTTEGSPERAVDLLVKQKGKTYPVGTVFNFDYTGTVQEVTLPPGRYKLQCWGAQGGDSYKYDAIGSKGGYSEGEITLTEVTTLYVFVGGKGGNGSTSSMVNGGWNGGGGSVGYVNYNGSATTAIGGRSLSDKSTTFSYPACGGGATDIATVTSDMEYSDYVTNRSYESYNSRCIVAGGGAGASGCRRVVTTYTTTDKLYDSGTNADNGRDSTSYYVGKDLSVPSGTTYILKIVTVLLGNPYSTAIEITDADGVTTSYGEGELAYVPWGHTKVAVRIRFKSNPATSSVVVSYNIYRRDTTASTDYSTLQSSGISYGGGVQSGNSESEAYASQNSGWGFGYGRNQAETNSRYLPGAGGGGWWGGNAFSSNTLQQLDDCGGGSGFVNTAENAQYLLDGYTGLQLDSGSTIDGGNSFPSPSGGNETGHSGNGYARITVIE